MSRVLNSKPGVSEGTRQAVHRCARRPGLRASHPPAAAERRPRWAGRSRSWRTRSSPRSRRSSRTHLPVGRFTPVLCTQSPGSLSEDEYVESLLDHGVAGIIFVSGKHADTRADHGRYQALLDRGLPVVFINGFVEGCSRLRSSRPTINIAMDIAVAHLAPARSLQDRTRDRPRALHAVVAQACGLRRRPWARTSALRRRQRRDRGSPRRSSRSRGGAAATQPAARAGCHGDRLRLET